MKILHTTDLHFNKHWFEWIAQQQDEFDVFCISGDFLEDTKDETLLEQIEWVSAWIRKFKKPLFTCSGNHDIEELENEDWLTKIDTSNYYTDNMSKTIDGFKHRCADFDLKLEFGYLTGKNAIHLFEAESKMLGIDTIERSVRSAVESLDRLAPGDFAAVRRQRRFAPIRTAEDLLERINGEISIKNQSRLKQWGFTISF